MLSASVVGEDCCSITPTRVPQPPEGLLWPMYPPRLKRILVYRYSGPQSSPPSDYVLGFGKVVRDTGFCRGRVCGRGRCRPGSPWHTLKHFEMDAFAQEVARAKRKSDLSVIQIPRCFDPIRGSIICAKHGPIQIDLHFTRKACNYPKSR